MRVILTSVGSVQSTEALTVCGRCRADAPSLPPPTHPHTHTHTHTRTRTRTTSGLVHVFTSLDAFVVCGLHEDADEHVADCRAPSPPSSPPPLRASSCSVAGVELTSCRACEQCRCAVRAVLAPCTKHLAATAAAAADRATADDNLAEQDIAHWVIGPIPWGHSCPLCHALSLLSMLLWTSMRRRCATVATPGEWQCKTGGVRRLAVVNGPNIFQMLLVLKETAFRMLMAEICTTRRTSVCGRGFVII